MRELEAQLAEVRSEVQEGRCYYSQAQFYALCVPHDGSGESTTLCQPTSSAYKDDAISSFWGRQSLPPVFVVSTTPEETPCPNRSESSAGASQQNFFVRTQQDTPPPPRRQNTDENAPRFKPMNLPKFNPKGNIHTFIRIFEMLMYGANNQGKATKLLNHLDAASTDLIIPHMPQNDWSYATAKQTLLYEFGSIARVTEQKNEFLMIQFQKDKSIAEFEDQFYLKAQVLTGSGLLTVHDAHIALHSAVKPYKVLYCTLMLAFQDNCSIYGMVQYLCQ
ncbi:hypothetical protein DSO57_1031068 [Entomophthora muscae]|uniref:Uncharacterized protein n=1 Tax=Entomophthora muscae TaxID=34485 RepID=A0ACC2TBY8_9FUNG|nr:hypothetical protein DSO57_1031068 [Entomophthora muscae]